MNNDFLLKKALTNLNRYCPYHSQYVLLNVSVDSHGFVSPNKIGFIDYLFTYDFDFKSRVIIDIVEQRIVIMFDNKRIVGDYI